MATWRVTPIMVATGDWGRIARVIASLRVHTRLLLVDAWRFRLRDRDLSRDRSVTTYFLRGDACRLFLFLSKLTAKASDCVCKDVTQSSSTSLQMYFTISLFFFADANKGSKSRAAVYIRMCWMHVENSRPYVFYTHLLLCVARVCIIMSRLYYKVEGLNGAHAADVWFLLIFAQNLAHVFIVAVKEY